VATENENATNPTLCIMFLEFGATMIKKSDTIGRKTNASRLIIKNIKPQKERQNAKSKFDLTCIDFQCKASPKVEPNAKRC
jgi:hypothetical protein